MSFEEQHSSSPTTLSSTIKPSYLAVGKRPEQDCAEHGPRRPRDKAAVTVLAGAEDSLRGGARNDGGVGGSNGGADGTGDAKYLDRVVMPLRTGGRGVGLCHRSVDIKARPTRAAAELIKRHTLRVGDQR